MGFLSGLLGMGKGASASSSVKMPSWLQQPTQDYLGRAVDLSKQEYTPYGGQTVAQFNPYQTQSIDAMFRRGMNGSPLTQGAQQGLLSTINGDYLSSGNPYLTGQIDKAQGDVVRNYNMAVKPQLDAAQVRSGSFGNTGLAEYQADAQRSLQDTLGNISTQMRGTDYANERNRQMSAIGMAPTLANQDYTDIQASLGAGGLLQGQEQANLDDSYSRWMQEQMHPYQQMQFLGSTINPLLGAYGGKNTQTQASDQSRYGNALGTVASLGSMLFSDARAKTDIKRVGETDSGKPIYTYKYKWGGPTHMGVMAQENPEAAAMTPAGLLAVDYSKVK